MNSFDVFDTLLARRYVTSDPIWEQLALEFKITNFSSARKSADTGSRSYSEIYDQLVAQGVLTVDMRNLVAHRELELEIEHSFPVQRNIDRVQDGDLLISDMYLPGSAILQFVRSIGLTKQVTIHQSNGDKSNGTIWSQLAVKPGVHLGDNANSDYTQAQNHNINAELYPGTGYTNYEQEMALNHFYSMATLSREVRLRSNEQQEFSDLASSLNLPFLFASCELLYRKYQGRPLVFLGRDCQLMHKIYNEYYELAYYLPFSRKVAYDDPETAIAYLRKHSPDNAMLVDISSTGGTWQQLPPIDITVVIYSNTAYYTPTKPVLPETFDYITLNSEIGQTNLILEVFNCGDHGHLNSINTVAPNVFTASFGEPELDKNIISAVQGPINQAVKLSNIYKQVIRQEFANAGEDQLIACIQYCTSLLCAQTDLYKLLGDFTNKETNYLNQFTNGKNS